MKNNESLHLKPNSSGRVPALLLFLSGFVIFMGIISGEIFYTLDFDSRDHYISELAASLVPGTPHPQPSSAIFNFSMIVAGILIILTAVLIHRYAKKLLFTLPLGLYGLGYLGVGIFPGNIAPWHGFFALILFIAGGISAITAYKIVHSPLRFVFMGIGIISLVFLIAFKAFVPLMGVGGTERWALYPVVFFLTGLGGYLGGESRNFSGQTQP